MAGLLVVASALAVAAWGLHAGDRKSVLAVGPSVSRGHVIERRDLVSVSVSGVDDALPVADVGKVVGQTAAVDLVPGQILTGSMLTRTPLPSQGWSVVGLSLDLTRVPGAGLAPGDQVDVIGVSVADAGSGRPSPSELDAPVSLTSGAQVYAVSGEASTGGQIQVTLAVRASDAPRLAAYSAQDRVAVIETAPGGVAPTAEATP